MTADHYDDLRDFQRRTVDHDGVSRAVYTSGEGPAVLVLPEMPGITPEVARFARWVRDAGLSAWMPSLFGEDGAPASLDAATTSMGSPCVRREFEAFAANVPSPMTQWLRHLAREAHRHAGGRGVGVVGMCFTGNFALAVAIEPSVLAAVMSQPSLPLDDPASTFLHDEQLVAIRQRLDRDDVKISAHRFDGDAYCQQARFDRLALALGDRFEPTVLPDEAAGEIGWVGTPHSVLTTSLIDEDGELTAQVRNDVIAGFVARLTVSPGK